MIILFCRGGKIPRREAAVLGAWLSIALHQRIAAQISQSIWSKGHSARNVVSINLEALDLKDRGQSCPELLCLLIAPTEDSRSIASESLGEPTQSKTSRRELKLRDTMDTVRIGHETNTEALVLIKTGHDTRARLKQIYKPRRHNASRTRIRKHRPRCRKEADGLESTHA